MHSINESSSAVLERMVSGNTPFALTRKEGEQELLLAEGDIASYDRLEHIPRKRGTPSSVETVDTVSAIPFSQIRERGFDAQREDARIMCLSVTNTTRISLQEALSLLPKDQISLQNGLQFDRDDPTYAELQQTIIDQEIGNGEGSSFVVPRRAEGRIEDFSRAKALSVFRSLLENEFGSYMTFVFSDGERYLVGASPERHLSVGNGEVRMNPISGTYRKTRAGIGKADLMRFLRDPKEINELFMVLDEEVKMMAQMCERGGEIRGPLLREMSRLIHTEYELVGQSDQDVLNLLRHSMFAPTVTGSPVENACRIIAKYDPRDRRYYSSALAMLGRDSEGNDQLDSAIMIRMMEIQRDGTVEMMAGSTLVRDSDPMSEAKETTAKLSALAGSLGVCTSGSGQPELPALRREVEPVLQERNANLSEFFFQNNAGKDLTVEELKGKHITVVTSDDDFSYTLGHMMTRLGAEVSVVDCMAYKASGDRADLVVVGPGTGDPNDMNSPKMCALTTILIDLEHGDRPFLTVCLGHQLLSKLKGLSVERKADPSQGVQKEIDYFGERQSVGFYNTFAARYRDIVGVEIVHDASTGEVYALRGRNFSSFQFHPESVLSQNGLALLRDELVRLVKACSVFAYTIAS